MSVGLCTAPGQALEGIDAVLDADARGQLGAAVGDSEERIGEEETGAGRGGASVTLTEAAEADGCALAWAMTDVLRLRCVLLAR
jgi:hypothetical protein